MLDFIKIRRFSDADTAYVTDSWSKSFYEYWKTLNVPARFSVARLDYHSSERKRIADALRLGETLLAVDTNDPDAIYGWICFQGQLVHYLYVRKDARIWAVEDLLLAAAGLHSVPVLASHWFPSMRAHPDRYILDLYRRGG